MAAERISAPYNFYLHFGVEGVQRARTLSADSTRDGETDSEMPLGDLGRCFRSDFGRPEEADDDAPHDVMP